MANEDAANRFRGLTFAAIVTINATNGRERTGKERPPISSRFVHAEFAILTIASAAESVYITAGAASKIPMSERVTCLLRKSRYTYLVGIHDNDVRRARSLHSNQRQEAIRMADPVLYKDSNGSIKHIEGGFYIRQPSSSSHAERENAARHACEAEGRRLIDAWNTGPFPMKMKFHSVNLVEMKGVTSRTETNVWTGVRHHECKGTGVAELLYTIVSGGGASLLAGELSPSNFAESVPSQNAEWEPVANWTLASR